MDDWADAAAGNPELASALDSIAGGTISHGDTEVFRPLVDTRRSDDPFLVLADYAAWQGPATWSRMSIRNSARSGQFSSDRAIAQYRDDIWNVGPVTVRR